MRSFLCAEGRAEGVHEAAKFLEEISFYQKTMEKTMMLQDVSEVLKKNTGRIVSQGCAEPPTTYVEVQMYRIKQMFKEESSEE